MEKLPDEITANILSRLPFKSSARSKCVSKQWCTILTDPTFPKLQLTHLPNIDPDILLYYQGQNALRKIYYLEDNAEAFTKEEPIKPFKKTKSEFIVSTFYDNPYILGSCNGFMCISEVDDWNISFFPRNPIYVFNPITKETAELPHFKVPKRQVPSWIHSGKKCDRCLCGFGFDDTVKEYKLVLVMFAARDYEAQIFRNEVQILTLGSKTWRWKIGIVPEELRFTCFSANDTVSTAVLHRCLHWITIDNNSRNKVPQIVSFDLNAEEFSVVPVPRSLKHHYNDYGYSLGLFQGYLSLVDSTSAFSEVWVMKKYNDKSSWVKQFSIQHSVVRPLGLSCATVEIVKMCKNGRVLLNCNREFLVSYNITTRNCQYIQLKGVLKFDMHDLVAHPFVGSTVSLMSAFGMDSRARKMGREEKMDQQKRSIFQMIARGEGA